MTFSLSAQKKKGTGEGGRMVKGNKTIIQKYIVLISPHILLPNLSYQVVFMRFLEVFGDKKHLETTFFSDSYI